MRAVSGIAADVAPAAQKIGKQIRHADRLGIPYVWFPEIEDQPQEVKNIISGEQVQADPENWAPDEDYASQRVVVA